MKPKSVMLIAGEPSGDILAAELVKAITSELGQGAAVPSTDFQPLDASLKPRFFGAGGPHMASAGVRLAFDLTAHSVTGLSEVAKKYFQFRRLFRQLFDLARQEEPDAIICVDFSGFNRRFAHAIRQYTRARQDWFHDWRPRLVQYVSPQVWASREARAFQIARDYDLLLSIIPFEKDWYAKRVPGLRVEFVGNPVVDRYGDAEAAADQPPGSAPRVLLLPGSRPSELDRHLPVLLGAVAIMRKSLPALQASLVFPNEALAEKAKSLGAEIQTRVGGLREALQTAHVALASTGTVTLECAWLGVPTVALYKTSWTTYFLARQLVKVKYLGMPNLLANEPVFPEFIQGAATAENLARAALDLLTGPRREEVKLKLADIRGRLGTPGASRRAAQAILGLLQ